MKTIYSAQHHKHHAQFELASGKLVPAFECPQRANFILEHIQKTGLGDILTPHTFPIGQLFSVHDRDYIEFLQSAWNEWQAAGKQGEIIPLCWPVGQVNTAKHKPENITSKVGYYAQSVDSNITAHTWDVAWNGAQAALTGAKHVLDHPDENSAFVLTRPPGHHAMKRFYGGYCFINNSALAAQYWREQGMERVAILDIDFHHGNGTQDIFYERDDVLTLSLHGDPRYEFPYFWGHADEQGQAKGKGYNINLPLHPGTEFPLWRATLKTALQAVKNFNPQGVVIALGLDTFEQDPISSFKLKTAHYLDIGADLATLQCPTLFVLEGGYAVEALAENTVNVLRGFSE